MTMQNSTSASTQLSDEQLAAYTRAGHLTVPGVFRAGEMQEAIGDIERWGEEFLGALPAEQRAWYVEGGTKAKDVLRKLDNPHFHRPAIQRLARDRDWSPSSRRSSARASPSTSARFFSRRPKAAGRSRGTRTTSISARAMRGRW